MSIEETIVPETINEMLLLERLREMRIASYEKHIDPFLPSTFSNELSFQGEPPIRLLLAAKVESEWSEDNRIVVRSRSYGPDGASLGFQRYLSEQMLNEMSPSRAAQFLVEMHKDLMYRLTKHLTGLNK